MGGGTVDKYVLGLSISIPQNCMANRSGLGLMCTLYHCAHFVLEQAKVTKESYSFYGISGWKVIAQ